MTWFWEHIDREWLAGSRIAVSPDEVVQAFITAERFLGLDWIESCRTSGGSTGSGSGPTLSVVVMGQKLQSIEGLVGSDALIARLRQGDRAAVAELTSIYLCRRNIPNVTVEIGVDVDIAGRTRKPDFRICRDDNDWTYVEVAAPDTSFAQQRAEKVLHKIAELLDVLPTGSTVEVFLRREPTDDEINLVTSATASLAKLTGSASRDLPGLALLLLNNTQPGSFTFDSHGEPPLPRLGDS